VNGLNGNNGLNG